MSADVGDRYDPAEVRERGVLVSARVVVVANLDPHSTRESTVHLNMPALGFDHHDTFAAHDLITDESWHWGEHNYIRLGPAGEPVHVLAIRRF